jgi:DnaJ-class molecular chaperone
MEAKVDPAIFVVGGTVGITTPFGEPAEFVVRQDSNSREMAVLDGFGIPVSQGVSVQRAPLLVKMVPTWPTSMGEDRRDLLRRYLEISDAGGIHEDSE